MGLKIGDFFSFTTFFSDIPASNECLPVNLEKIIASTPLFMKDNDPNKSLGGNQNFYRTSF